MCIYCGTDKYRRIYEHHYGQIPKDETGRKYEIHHIDGKRSNNDPNNLIAVSIKEHYDIHYSQGDWSACLKISGHIQITPEEKSELSRKAAYERLAAGVHHFLDKEAATKRNLKRVKNGTHPFLRRADGTSRTSDRVKDGTNPFLKRPDGTSVASDRVKNGTHPWQGAGYHKARNREMLENGTHPSQQLWKCEHCGTSGKGASNFKRWHGDKCKSK
jgi:hypothetical protein